MLGDPPPALAAPSGERDPVEPHADTFLVWGGGPFPGFTIGTLHLYASKGTVKQHAVFAYSDHEDDRANVKDYRRTITKQGMLNTAYSLPPGFPDVSAGKVLTWNDARARAPRTEEAPPPPPPPPPPASPAAPAGRVQTGTAPPPRPRWRWREGVV